MPPSSMALPLTSVAHEWADELPPAHECTARLAGMAGGPDFTAHIMADDLQFKYKLSTPSELAKIEHF